MHSASRTFRQNGHASKSQSSSGRSGAFAPSITFSPRAPRASVAPIEVATESERSMRGVYRPRTRIDAPRSNRDGYSEPL